MTLKLHYHPLSSFCQKVLIALYENDTPCELDLIDLGDETSRAALLKLWPLGQFPVLSDAACDRVVPESSIIIEYLDQHFPGPTRFIPQDPDLARQMRMRDRFYDLHVNTPMQKIVTDRLRPPGQNDAYGVERARNALGIACDLVEREMASRTWAMGEAFTMADCAAAPALFYAARVLPLKATHPVLMAYLDRLMRRPSYARVLDQAKPYLAMFPD